MKFLRPSQPFSIAAALGLACVASLLAADPAASPAAKPAPLFADEVLVKAESFEIKRSQLDEAAIAFTANAAARGQAIALSSAELDAKLLEKLITVETLKARASEADRKKAGERADKLIAEMQARAVSITDFVRQLQVLGTTTQKLREQMYDQLVSEGVVEREVRPGITVTSEQIKKFFDDNAKQFQTPEMVRVAHILFRTRDDATRLPLSTDRQLERRAQADKALARIRAGEDFAKLVKEFSDDLRTRDAGGEYTFGRGQMAPEFEAAAFGLAPNQVSDVVVSGSGFHIIKLLERLPAGPVPIAKVEERIKEALIGAELERLMPAYLERVKKEADVKIVSPPGR